MGGENAERQEETEDPVCSCPSPHSPEHSAPLGGKSAIHIMTFLVGRRDLEIEAEMPISL